MHGHPADRWLKQIFLLAANTLNFLRKFFKGGVFKKRKNRFKFKTNFILNYPFKTLLDSNVIHYIYGIFPAG